MKQKIAEELRQLLHEYMGDVAYEKCGKIEDDTHLKFDLALDSLDMWCILMEIENKYNFNFTSGEEVSIAEEKPTFGNLVRVVHNKLNNKQ